MNPFKKINSQFSISVVCIAALFLTKVAAQTTTVIPKSGDTRVITTGAPFLLIATDARAAGMGDI